MAAGLDSVLSSFLSDLPADDPAAAEKARALVKKPAPKPQFEEEEEELANPLGLKPRAGGPGQPTCTSSRAHASARSAAQPAVSAPHRQLNLPPNRTVVFKAAMAEAHNVEAPAFDPHSRGVLLRTMVSSVGSDEVAAWRAGSSTARAACVCAVVAVGDGVTDGTIAIGDFMLLRRSAIGVQDWAYSSLIVLADLSSALATGRVAVRVPNFIVSPEDALLAEDELSAGVHAATLMADALATLRACPKILTGASRGSSCFVVLGCGPIGLMTIVALRALLDQSVAILAADGSDAKRTLAATYGATEACTPQELRARLSDVDGVVEADGDEAMLDLGAAIVADGGIFALLSPPRNGDGTLPESLSPARCFARNLTIRYGSGGRTPALLTKAFEVLRTRPSQRALTVGVNKVVTHRMPYADAQRAIELTADTSSSCVKAMLYPDGETQGNDDMTLGGMAAHLPPGKAAEDISAADVAAAARTPATLAASLD